MTASSSFRQLLESLPQQSVQQALARAYKQENQADRERMAQAMEYGATGACDIGDSQRGANYDLNRYSDVVPFDSNRVRLQGKHDYINASQITLPTQLSPNKYIATQGPLNHSVGDFWRMVWEQQTRGIVMLANPVEGLRAKCAVYWPQTVSASLRLGDIEATLVDERPMRDCLSVTVRKIRLTHAGAPGVAREVTQFHYTEWPDHGVPTSPVPLLQIVRELRSTVSPDPETPVVVHCSAGVGRTGTFIIIDAAMGYFAKNADYPGDFVGDAFKAMRRQRTMMVQTLSQYMMCYQVISFILGERH
ncbi:Tyrosine-protein phosphatase non-receptor type 13 [Coemansia sp. RSA 2599]|nr:Tyrosine-protein phosphatase non-receptor type 13 [Coemansia sp. RSA 2598]KAJ1819414.1 Tyrosine-protein phosphatase non-receptor type 13 [Coemansia sp. RSA 2599]